MTQAEITCDAYYARTAQWPGIKFRKPKGTTVETDAKLPGVRFFRFRDASVIRMDANGDVQA